MKVLREFARKLPWWVRVPAGAALLLVVLKLRASILIGDFTDALSEMGDVEYDGSYFDWHGNIGAKNLVFTKYDDEGRVLGEFAMDRMEIEPPSWWLLRNVFLRGGTRYVPDDIGLRLENFRNTADRPDTPGNYTNLPYDAMGCAPAALTPNDITAMGLRSPRRDVSVALHRASDQDADATFALETPGLGRVSVVARVGVKSPIRMRELAEVLEEAPVRGVTARFDDLGFIKARNAACASRHHMDAGAFQAYHLQEVHRWMDQVGLGYNEATLRQYATFAKDGGKLVVRTAGERNITLMQFVRLGVRGQLQAYPLQVAANDATPVSMVVMAGAPVAQQPAQAAGVAPAPLAATAVTANAAKPAPGAELPYDAVAPLIGEHFTVQTRYGGERQGRVLVYSPMLLSFKLDDAAGGFKLTLYRDDILKIRYTPEPAASLATGT